MLHSKYDIQASFLLTFFFGHWLLIVSLSFTCDTAASITHKHAVGGELDVNLNLVVNLNVQEPCCELDLEHVTVRHLIF